MAKCFVELGNCSAEICCDDSCIDDLWDFWVTIVKPALRGCGFKEDSINATIESKGGE